MRVGRYINEVCLLLNVTVLTDIVVVQGEGDEIGVQPMFAIGQDGEAAAGIQFVPITKFYSSEDALDEFCELNINRFRIAAQQQTAVDATEWR